MSRAGRQSAADGSSQAFAIIRVEHIDDEESPVQRRLSVEGTVPNIERAKKEVERLNAEHADGNCYYYFSVVDTPAAGQHGATPPGRFACSRCAHEFAFRKLYWTIPWISLECPTCAARLKVRRRGCGGWLSHLFGVLTGFCPVALIALWAPFPWTPDWEPNKFMLAFINMTQWRPETCLLVSLLILVGIVAAASIADYYVIRRYVYLGDAETEKLE